MWLFACVPALLPLVGIPLSHAVAVSPAGSDSSLAFPFLAFCLALLALCAIPLVAILALVPATQRYGGPTLLACILFIAATWSGEQIGGRLRMRGFARLAERSRPLVEAIEAYVADHGEPPDKLQDLVPKYLPAVPRTDMPAYPEYEYEKGGYGDNPWVLRVQTPSGGLNWDEFIYLPLQDYRLHFYDPVELLGDWGYVHE